MDLAAARVINAAKPVLTKPGDLIEILEPFTKGENFIGIVVKVTGENIHVYHSNMKKTIIWNRRVMCSVSQL